MFQGAWSAIATTDVLADDPRSGVFVVDHLRLALKAAVRGGEHADTVAAVAGGLLGAAYGATAIPWRRRPILRGWPGLNTHLLVNLAEKICDGWDPQQGAGFGCWRDFAAPQPHPHGDGVWIGVAAWLEKLPDGVGAVCRSARSPRGICRPPLAACTRRLVASEVDVALRPKCPMTAV